MFFPSCWTAVDRTEQEHVRFVASLQVTIKLNSYFLQLRPSLHAFSTKNLMFSRRADNCLVHFYKNLVCDSSWLSSSHQLRPTTPQSLTYWLAVKWWTSGEYIIIICNLFKHEIKELWFYYSCVSYYCVVKLCPLALTPVCCLLPRPNPLSSCVWLSCCPSGGLRYDASLASTSLSPGVTPA